MVRQLILPSPDPVLWRLLGCPEAHFVSGKLSRAGQEPDRVEPARLSALRSNEAARPRECRSAGGGGLEVALL